jgi:hypothetical protein
VTGTWTAGHRWTSEGDLRRQLTEVTKQRDLLMDACQHALATLTLDKTAKDAERLGLSGAEDRRRAARRRNDFRKSLLEAFPRAARAVFKKKEK